MRDMDSHKEKSIPTVFHDVISSDLPAREKTLDRLYQEGQTFVAAGTETTAWCLTVITFYLIENPTVMEKLRTELQNANASTGAELEKLPYLSAVIQEGLRLSFGVCTRLARIAPIDTLVLRDGQKVWEIPPNVCSLFSQLITF
jgi:cytochrome P450